MVNVIEVHFDSKCDNLNCISGHELGIKIADEQINGELMKNEINVIQFDGNIENIADNFIQGLKSSIYKSGHNNTDIRFITSNMMLTNKIKKSYKD